ncbi:hypothetical protein EDB84DRAFT_1572890 [Lactarius hengduanensis]|nr:hypothetical protein EDB84DRAFT_1572890 [Lactarius hengduanensis]
MHQEFQSVLCLILKSFLNCVEGLQALNGNITEVIEGIESTTDIDIRAHSITPVRHTVFLAESANMLMSKDISAQADQHVGLDLRGLVKTFDEC